MIAKICILLSIFLYFVARADELPNREPATESIGPTAIQDTLTEPQTGFMHWEFLTVGDAFRNFQGGARTGSDLLGFTALRANFDMQRAVGWTGGSAFVQLQSTYGRDPSLRVGDLQVTDNGEAPADTAKVYEAWLQQSLFDDRLSFLFGLYDLNSEFYVTESSALFLNSSFGIGTDLAQTGSNGPSIFPTPGLALRIHVRPAQNFFAQIAMLEAESGSPTQPHGTQIKYDSTEGHLLAAEAGYSPGDAKYAIGAWTYTKKFDHRSRVDAAGDPVKAENQGAYALIDQPLSEGLSAFLRYGQASSGVNQISSNFAAGFVYTGIFKQPASADDDADQVGLAWTSVNTEPSEQVIELTYSLPVGDHLVVQPDLQYVMNPGMNPALDDALAGYLRLVIQFEGER